MTDQRSTPASATWDEIEQAAQAGMQRDEVDLPPLRPIIEVDDPMLVVAQMNALRMAADTLGMKHDPNWDATEAAAGDQMRRHNDEPEDDAAPA